MQLYVLLLQYVVLLCVEIDVAKGKLVHAEKKMFEICVALIVLYSVKTIIIHGVVLINTAIHFR